MNYININSAIKLDGALLTSMKQMTLYHQQIVCRSTHTQHIRRQELCCRRATCLEQSSDPLARLGHYIQQFQA